MMLVWHVTMVIQQEGILFAILVKFLLQNIYLTQILGIKFTISFFHMLF